ncbi:DsbA family protein [Hymenobacter sp. CRA2]|uniref:DsbA family oxidoreductase n=1 Tax=Hymenobacter sp. CRA2 TaxID=1955620 RepID=UPI00098F5735|nr:DsbA family oxidoreductase [Hymenobacter sp. CRA2]OON67713.1 disulfide bond formation protein DsbA [Hymenobacter sp. CRA2]
MKVEIWSDIMCPFCYIGKRRFEAALQQFAHHQQVEVTWHSFELDPNMETRPGQSIHELLAERKGVSVAEAKRMNDHMAGVAQEVGLHYDFDKVQPVNTFNAHRFAHLAAAQGRQDAAEERLFAAYFTEGLNIDDADTLTRLGTDIGLDADAVRTMLASDQYAQEVRVDEYHARQIGVRGVPYFVFNDKYAVSGAQPAELFQEVLEKVWDEFNPQPVPTVISGADGPACGVDGADC